jgi:uracil-DNA glycosylase family 4
LKSTVTLAAQTIGQISRCVSQCELCPELRLYGANVASVKRKAYRDEKYWGKPVPCFGDSAAQIMLVGLAPGAHGSHRTGRMFTGDSSGDFLFPALHKVGLATQANSVHKNDGLQLKNCIITSASRCAPPDNRPTRAQLAKCFPYLLAEFSALPNLRVLIALGAIGFDAILNLLDSKGFELGQTSAKFVHGGEITAQSGARTVTVLSTYHPSRQNTNTNRLTAKMIEAVFRRAVDVCAFETPQPESIV